MGHDDYDSEEEDSELDDEYELVKNIPMTSISMTVKQAEQKFLARLQKCKTSSMNVILSVIGTSMVRKHQMARTGAATTKFA